MRSQADLAGVPAASQIFFKEGIDAVEGASLAAAPEQEVSAATGQGERVVPFSRLLDSGNKFLRQRVESYDEALSLDAAVKAGDREFGAADFLYPMLQFLGGILFGFRSLG